MNYYFYVVALIISLAACQKDPNRMSSHLQGAGSVTETQLVQAADGTLYSKDCLQENVAQIEAAGSSAMAVCQMKVTFNSQEASTENTTLPQGDLMRNRFFYSNGYASIYYPPTYWNGNNNYANNLFCGFIFGSNYNFNCYALFGYNNSNYSNYSSYYNPSCNYCLYAPNPTRCRYTCYHYSYYRVY